MLDGVVEGLEAGLEAAGGLGGEAGEEPGVDLGLDQAGAALCGGQGEAVLAGHESGQAGPPSQFLAGWAVSTLALTVMVRPLTGWVLFRVILFPALSCPDASRNSGFHCG